MARVTKFSKKAIDIIRNAEGLRLKAYLCPAGKPTIGIGTTRYPDGHAVKLGDICTEQQAYDWCAYDMMGAAKDVDDLTTDAITQCQFDALVSFVYNFGRGNYASSTLRRLINANPNDRAIDAEFRKWNRADNKVSPGLVKRRAAESALYFSGE